MNWYLNLWMSFFFKRFMNHFMHQRIVRKKRWSICEGCEHFDAPEEGCKECGCYLPHKIKDPWGDCPLDKWISNDEEWKNKHYNQLKDVIIEKYPEYQEFIEKYERIN